MFSWLWLSSALFSSPCPRSCSYLARVLVLMSLMFSCRSCSHVARVLVLMSLVFLCLCHSCSCAYVTHVLVNVSAHVLVLVVVLEYFLCLPRTLLLLLWCDRSTERVMDPLEESGYTTDQAHTPPLESPTPWLREVCVSVCVFLLLCV